jgi:formyltetrahydrofolate deformylase
VRGDRARLLVACPDRPGIVAAISQLLFARGANIVHSDQHSTGAPDFAFYMRVEFDLAGLAARIAELEAALAALAPGFRMEWRLAPSAREKRLAVFVSKEDHCLVELLWRRSAGDLPAEIALIVSNHADLEPLARARGIPFHHVPIEPQRKEEAEARELAILDGAADAVVLARYMQILSPEFVRRFPSRIINIHHGFLPAFVGPRAYHQAHERGVKLIGATAHYVTGELDAGPIIEQDVQRVDHRHGAAQLRRIGRHIERQVLARAVVWHAEDRVLVHGNRTVVFS